MSWCVRGCGSTKHPPLSGLHLATLSKQFRFSPQEILLYRKRFDHMTKTSSFDLLQFRENMGLLGLESTSILADRIFAVMNRTGNGRVSFDEYLFYMDVLSHGSEDEKAELSFKLITKGLLDPITFSQFAEMIISIWKLYNTITGSRVIDSEETIKNMFSQLDLNHDGLVDMREYKQCWRTNRQLFVWFELISSRMSGNVKIEDEEEDRKTAVLRHLQDVEQEVRDCLELIEPSEVKSEPGNEIEGLTPEGSGSEDETYEDAGLPDCPLLGNGPVLTASRRDDDQLNAFTETSESLPKNLASKLHSVISKINDIKALMIDEEQKEEEKRVKGSLNIQAKRGLSHISWGDENWNLIVNMMLGIQKAVRTASATDELLTELTDAFFSQKCKHVVLPLPVGTSAKNKIYKFRDYAPFVFERLRLMYGISVTEYVRSLGVEKILESWLLGSFSSLEGLCSSGKSGSFFFYSDDGKYMLKTLPKEEFLLFRKMLKGYFQYLTAFPNSLITRIYGLHKILFKKKLRPTRLYFIVMGNVFGKSYEIHSRYDLKGSRVGRSTEKALDQDIARKDLDFNEIGMKIQLGDERKAQFLSILEQDCHFLEGFGLIDYSILIGIHGLKGPWVDPKPEQIRFVPFAEMNGGGLVSTDGTMLYFIGIIDILTFYGSKKKLEHAAKSFIYDNEAISCVPPRQYADRFMAYIASIVG